LAYAVIIPARYDSERLPGKPIIRAAKEVTGKYIIEHVYENALKAKGVRRVIVATDDERILNAVRSFGGQAELTSPKHKSGTDRIAEVAAHLADVEIVVNVQGDEPEVRPAQIEQVARLIESDSEAVVGTLAVPVTSEEELADPNTVKVVLDARGYAMYFSREPIPHVRGAQEQLKDSPVRHLKHIGIYSYRLDFLLSYSDLPPSGLELAERLEQLRVIESGFKIRVGITDFSPVGIDTEADLELWLERCRKAQA